MPMITPRLVPPEKLVLLDDVLDRFLDDQRERKFYKKRMVSKRVMPIMRMEEMKHVPERPRFSERLGQGLSSSNTQSDTVGSVPRRPSMRNSSAMTPRSVLPGISAERGSTPGAFVGGQGRQARVRNGKALLQATTSSVQPIFREVTPLSLNASATQHAEVPGADPQSDVAGPFEEAMVDPSPDAFALDLMMSLDSENLASLKQQFAKYRNELDIFEFVSVMQQHLPQVNLLSEEKKVAMVANLSELFAQVDVNGDEKMEWQELTSFIVEAQIGSQMSKASFASYKPITPLLDQGRIRSEQSVERIFYLDTLDFLVLCERPAPLVAVYSPKTHGCMAELRGHKAEVLAVEHIEEVGCLVTSGADLALCWWDVAGSTPSFRLRQRALLQHPQHTLRWCAARRWLLSGGADGTIHLWDVCSLEVVGRLTGHEDAVTAMIVMKQRREWFATSSLDRSIRLWDLMLDSPRCCVTLGPHRNGASLQARAASTTSTSGPTAHERGVTCLAFSPMQRHLFSGGLDHELLVWNPLSEKVICALRQHTAPLVAIETVAETPQLVSADLSGICCVWDTSSLSCAQKLTVSVLPGQELTAMCLLAPHRQIMAACRRLTCFQGPDEPEPDLTDSYPIIAGLYNVESGTFCTASSRNIMIWDAAEGHLLRTYADATPAPITAMCFDDRERKLLVADHSGNISVLNYSNGAHMKTMAMHASEVSALLYVPARRFVLSTSWDRTLKLHDESPPDAGKLLRSTHTGHRCDITTAALSNAFQLVATGADDGSLQIWRLDERCYPHAHYELRGHIGCITSLCFLEPWPLLASADASGVVRVWTTQFALPMMRYRQLLQLTNLASTALWSASWLRTGTVQINSRNTDGTLSQDADKVSTARDISSQRWRDESQRTASHIVSETPSGIVSARDLARRASSGLTPSLTGRAAHSQARKQDTKRETHATASSSATSAPKATQPAAAFLTEVAGPSVRKATPDACAVTAICFSSERQTLNWGDDSGRILTWDMSALLQALPRTNRTDEMPGIDSGMQQAGRHTSFGAATATEPSGAQAPSSLLPRSRRRSSSQASDGSGRESVWLISKLQGITVYMTHLWQAHSDAISSLTSISHPPALFSTSADRLASVWSHDGSERYGSLQRGAGDQPRRDSSHNNTTEDVPGMPIPADSATPSRVAPPAAGGPDVAATPLPVPAISSMNPTAGNSSLPAATVSTEHAPGARCDATNVGKGLGWAAARTSVAQTAAWRFPVDHTIPQQVRMDRASTILQKVHSDGFQSRHRSLETPLPSEDDHESVTDATPSYEYEPVDFTRLCLEAWSKSRSPDRLLGQRMLAHRTKTWNAAADTNGPCPDAEEPGILATDNVVQDVVSCMVHKLRQELIGQRLRVLDFFQRIDANRDGAIGFAELQEALAGLGIYAHPEAVEALFESLDQNRGGSIEYSELQDVLKKVLEPGSEHDASRQQPASSQVPLTARSELLSQMRVSGTGSSLTPPALDSSNASVPVKGALPSPRAPSVQPIGRSPRSERSQLAHGKTAARKVPKQKLVVSAAAERLDALLAADMFSPRSIRPHRK